MKTRLLLFATFMTLIIPPSLYAQNGVNFGFHDGIEDGYLKRTMERNASLLLTAINVAEANGSDIYCCKKQ